MRRGKRRWTGHRRHDVAVLTGEETHEAGLNLVGILIFVYHDLAEALAHGFEDIRASEEKAFQLEEQVVVIQQGMLALIVAVGVTETNEVFGMGQKMLGLAAQNLVKLHFLVTRLAQEAEHSLHLWEASVALAYLEVFLAGGDGGSAVRRIHDAEASLRPVRSPAAKHGKGEAVESAALHAKELAVQQAGGALEHLLRSLAGESEQEHGMRIPALFRQPGEAIDYGTRLAGARAGYDQHGPFRSGHSRSLGIVQNGKVEHGLLGAGLSFAVLSSIFHWSDHFFLNCFDAACFAQACPELVDAELGNGRDRHRLHAEYALPGLHLGGAFLEGTLVCLGEDGDDRELMRLGEVGHDAVGFLRGDAAVDKQGEGAEGRRLFQIVLDELSPAAAFLMAAAA